MCLLTTFLVKGELRRRYRELWNVDGADALFLASRIITPERAQAYFQHAGFVMRPLQ